MTGKKGWTWAALKAAHGAQPSPRELPAPASLAGIADEAGGVQGMDSEVLQGCTSGSHGFMLSSALPGRPQAGPGSRICTSVGHRAL